MKQRIITGAVLIGFVLIVGIIDNRYLTSLVIAAVSIAAMFEAKKLFETGEDVFYYLSALSVLAIFIDPLFIAAVGVLGVAGYVAYYQKDLNLTAIALYPFLPMMIILKLYLLKGMGMIGWLVLITAATDSFAYFVGKNLGRKFFNRGFSKTSPNKSIEGVIGGVVLAVMIGSLAGLYFFDFLKAFYIALFVSVASVFGDLFESYLKRRAGVKDSGNILPGHGGVLDRVDGYLFSGVMLYVLVG
ncbi:MAG: phosphatidate cytidylyltransferase [Epsilonproteobacteria bacterium]|nr:phosphatidate cytidylyltransferase [Campylobacterota bacterium]